VVTVSSKVVEGAVSFGVIALLSLSAVAAFGSVLGSEAPVVEGVAAKRLLGELGTLFKEMPEAAKVVVHFPTSAPRETLTMEGDLLVLAWEGGSASSQVPGLRGDFNVSIAGAVEFAKAGGALGAFNVG
jgi:hypothetical protein